jgi:iron complex transport system substrate-binding protein
MNPVRQRIAARTPIVWVLIALLAGGCDHKNAEVSRPGKQPSVASLVPAATDLLIAMGAKDHLVAVSDYDQGAEVALLPHAGAYQSVDWEKLAAVRPALLISFYGPGKEPPGFLEKLASLQIRQVNVQPNRLDDIYSAIKTLGGACNEQKAADDMLSRIQSSIATVRKRYEGQPRVRTLIAISPSGEDLVGRNTYLDDLLQAAGGENALSSNGYVTLDREAIAALHPDAILQLLPDRDAASAKAAQQQWNDLSDCPAVKNHRVAVFTQTYIMQPGSHVAEIADLFAKAIH